VAATGLPTQLNTVAATGLPTQLFITQCYGWEISVHIAAVWQSLNLTNLTCFYLFIPSDNVDFFRFELLLLLIVSGGSRTVHQIPRRQNYWKWASRAYPTTCSEDMDVFAIYNFHPKHLMHEVRWIKFKNSAPPSQKTQCVSVRKSAGIKSALVFNVGVLNKM